MNRSSFHQLLKSESLYYWHKPGEGLLLLGENKDFSSDFGSLALRPAIEEGIFSFLVLGEDTFSHLDVKKDPDRVTVIDLNDISELSLESLYEKIDQILTLKPLALVLRLPTYTRTFYSTQERKMIRKIVQQVVMWIDSNTHVDSLDKRYQGTIFLDRPEKYISKEQSGLVNQINDLKAKDYCTGFHYHLIPKAIDEHSSLINLIGTQSFVLMLDKKLKRNVDIFNVFRNRSLETGSYITKIMSLLFPCPQTLISESITSKF